MPPQAANSYIIAWAMSFHKLLKQKTDIGPDGVRCLFGGVIVDHIVL